MTLAALIRGNQKTERVEIATAIPATGATGEGVRGGTVARIATVAVANSTAAKTATMTAEQEATIRDWLAHIGEAEPEVITDVLDQCGADTGALTYFLQRSEVWSE